MDPFCDFKSDWKANGLAFILITGLCVSYAPQLLRIIRAGTSIGFSPWFLLLGCTSSAAAMLNMYRYLHFFVVVAYPVVGLHSNGLPYDVVRKCLGKCIEQTAGVLQVGTQWFLFNMILVLYMLYYPPNLKYVRLDIDTHDAGPIHHVRTKLRSSEWRLSVMVSWIVFLHLAVCTLTTLVLLADASPLLDPTMPRLPQTTLWATFLGVTSGVLAAVQYAPQIIRTYQLKLVGALSIPMMVIQSPGGIVMAVSIAMRPGTDWTSWMMYAVSAVMQGWLLAMCFMWKIRQRRLGIDDFGRLLGEAGEVVVEDATRAPSDDEDRVSVVIEGDEAVREDTPLLKPGSVVHRGGLLGWIQGLGK